MKAAPAMRLGFMRSIVSILDRSSSICIPAIMAVVVLAGAAYSVHLGNNLRFPDERDYCALATHVASSGAYTVDGETPNIFRPPGYPMFLAVFALCGGGVIAFRFANYVLLAGVVYLAARLARTHAAPGAGMLTALGILCYPALFYTAGTLFPQTLGAFLLLATLCFLTSDHPRGRDFVAAGAAFGLLVLAIPSCLLLLPPLGIATCLGKDRAYYQGFAVVVIVCLVPVFAWCARNYMAFGSPVFISANSGLNLLLGNSENATQDSGSTTDISRYRRAAIDAGLTFVERDAYYRAKAVEWMSDHKRQAAALFCKKFLNYFNYRNSLEVSSESSSLRNLLMLATYAPLLILAMVRFALARRYRPSRFELLLALLYVANAFIYAIHFTRIRFRVPFDVLLICMVAMFVDAVLRRRAGIAVGCDSAGALRERGQSPEGEDDA